MPRDYQRITVTDSITRPANTTAYAAGDVISDATGNAHHTFVDVGKPYIQAGVINGAIIQINANQGTKPDLELWLFDTDISTVADNSAFAPTDTEILTCIGVIKFGVSDFLVGLSGSGASGNIVLNKENLDIVYRLPSTTSIFGQLVVRNAYTPISGEQFSITLNITRDNR